MNKSMNLLREAIKLVQESRRAYIFLNVVYYGLVIIAMLYSFYDRSVQEALGEQISLSFSQGMLSPVLEAYTTGQIISAAGLTFIVNLILGSFICITLPSMIIPFSGFIIAMVRAVLWGILFSPVMTDIGINEIIMGILIAILIFLEGQAYVLAMFGAFLHGKAFLWPDTVGAASRMEGYRRGLGHNAKVYVLVVLVLIVAAVYEASIAILIFPFLM